MRTRPFRRFSPLAFILIALSLALSAFAFTAAAPADAQCVPGSAPRECAPTPCPPGAVCTLDPIGPIPIDPWPMPIVPPGCCGVSTNPDWLKIPYHRVHAAIADSVAETTVEMAFVNEGSGLAEGTFVFPLPAGAAVDNLTMFIDGVPIEARILDADEARAYYDAIVRQYRDPALLEYVGLGAVQASVFPIPPGETRAIALTYTQPLTVDNGLVEYVYPLDVTRLATRRPIEQMSVSVTAQAEQAIGAIYSPTHSIAVSRSADERGFRAGFEQNAFVPAEDFTLYFGVRVDTITANLLSYRESAAEDGYFMLIVQPPTALAAEQRRPRDFIIVLDQSGSMQGEKWSQAQAAAQYVLGALGEGDRFNVVLFSTGWRVFGREMNAQPMAAEASAWVGGQFADGGTDIGGALATAFDMALPERDTTVLFLTDGLPTEGESDPDRIFAALTAQAERRAREGVDLRVFSFGVGDDVDTFLLDRLTREFDGASSYVRPTERIDEEVASLWNRISQPALEDIALTLEGATIEQFYPAAPLPDLYAGTQFTLVGRYRQPAASATLTLTGTLNGEPQTYTYTAQFRERAGGESFIARLWATRRIGELLNRIRLDGETPELIDSIISLSIRFGIITPYTSFLIDENDILTQSGQDAAREAFAEEAELLSSQASGANAVGAADMAAGFAAAAAPAASSVTRSSGALPSPAATMGAPGGASSIAPADEAAPQEAVIQTVGGKTFLLQNGVWTDTQFAPDTMTTEPVAFLSDAYFALVSEQPALAPYLALGERVIVVYEGVVYEVTDG
jgi:Ca-activated chloride channel family protein